MSRNLPPLVFHFLAIDTITCSQQEAPAKLTKFALEALEKSDLRSVTYGRLNLIHVFTYLDKFNS